MSPSSSKPSPESLGVGKVTARWSLAMLLAAGLAAAGVLVWASETSHGLIVTGMRSVGQGGATWGLYIAFAVYAIGVSFAGVSTAALVCLFRLKPLEPLTRIAELLTIVALLVGGLCILADLGRPLIGLYALPRYARPSSPFFGTFTLVVSGYLFASLVYFYLAGRADAAALAHRGGLLRWLYRLWASGWAGTAGEHRRHERTRFWLSIFILPILVTAHSTLGFVFGIQGGRPGWFSALQAPGFVVLAGASGIGMLIVLAAILRKVLGLHDLIREDAFRMLGTFLWVLTLTVLYFMVVEELTATYAASHADARVAHEIVAGAYAPLFWSTLTCFVLVTASGFVQFATGHTSVAATVAGGVLVNVGALLKRLLIVVPSQTHGMLLPYPDGHYIPTLGEGTVVMGLIGLAAIAILVFAKVFPIVPVTDETPDPDTIHEPASGPADPVRRLAFGLTLGAGLTAVVAGVLLSARVGTLPYDDPIVPFSPVVFIVGVMLTFYSAAVYETFPPARKRR